MRRSEYEDKAPRNASKIVVGIVVSEFHTDITHRLLLGAYQLLNEWKVKEKNIIVRRVPGAFDIPFACQQLLKKNKKITTMIALGCVIKGETKHDEYINNAVAQGIMRVQLERGVPIAFGVITPNTLEQAQDRSEGKHNSGRFAAQAALEMALS